jgi:type VI secretion system protein ImpK
LILLFFTLPIARASARREMANLKDDISRSMGWLRGSLSMAAPKREASGPAGQQESQNPLRDVFTDLIAYVLLFVGALDERSPALGEVRAKITSLIDEQERGAKSGRVPWEAYLEARFAVLSWVDETILTSSWASRNQWQHLMSAYYGTLNAGEEFFDHLERLPSAARDVKEIYYLCLKLGFLGKLALADSAEQVADLRRTLYRQISGAPNDIRQHYSRLFPEAYRPPQIAKPQAPSRKPLLWFGLAILVPILLFTIYWLLLRQQSDRLLARLEAPPAREAAAPPAPVDWSRSLIEELRSRKFEVEDSSRGVVVTLPGVLFEVSSAKLSPAGEQRIEELARVMKQYAPTRKVAVEGHASRERGTLDETNQRLAEDRGRNAAEVLIKNGLAKDRVTSRGLGSSTPVASNDTEEGRRKNRRIEIIIDKTAG